MSRRPQNSQSGFTLLEVVVAFAVAALALGAVFHVYGTAFGGSERAERLTIALLAAESKLAEVAGTALLKPGRTTGTLEDGYHWLAVVQPYLGTPETVPEQLPVRAYQIEVTVSWGAGGGQAVSLNTVRLVPRNRHGQAR